MSSFKFAVSDGTPVVENKPLILEDNEVQPQGNSSPNLNNIEVSYDELQKFIENPKTIHDEFEYKRTGTDPGLVLIFNQQQFENNRLKKRTGTNRDVNELILTFGRLGYNVDKKYVLTNLTRREILDVLSEVSKDDHSDRNSLIIIILTHGNENNELEAKDAPLWIKEIFAYFTRKKCPSLADKPKFFIFQACKGENFSQRDATHGELVPSSTYSSLEPDMLVAFAAVEETQSYRHPFNGTWFIQELCQNFSTFGRRDDVVSMLIRTTKCVANNYFLIIKEDQYMCPNDPIPIRKQMPLFVSTLTKKFYLTKSKDRNLILQLLEGQKNIDQVLQDMKKKVDTMYDDRQKKINSTKTLSPH